MFSGRIQNNHSIYIYIIILHWWLLKNIIISLEFLCHVGKVTSFTQYTNHAIMSLKAGEIDTIHARKDHVICGKSSNITQKCIESAITNDVIA